MKIKGEITRIDSDGVWGKVDNPFKKPIKPQETDTSERTFIEASRYLTKISIWKEVEANRKEYKIKEDLFYFNCADQYFIRDCEGETIEVHLGDRFEGEIQDNEFINVKLI